MWSPATLTTPEATAVVIILSVSVAVLFLYQLSLPKPLPGIPYNKSSARSILGDLPEVAKFQKETRLFWIWLTQLAERLQAPIAQVFLRPLGKPYVIVTDYREAHDILVHRSKEFDRADFFRDTMGPLTPDAHILFKTDDNFRLHRKVIGDLMSPAFLQNVAAPSLYTNLCKHIHLWNAKSRLAQGHPFEAIDDIYYSAFDAVTSFTFSDNFTHNATKSRVSFYTSVSTDKVPSPSGKDEAVIFPGSPIVDEFVEAFRELALVYEEVLASMWPRLQWFFILRRPRVRHAVSVKESVFHREIEEGIQRLDGGKNESRVKSAMDHMLLREATIALKEGRRPDFHRRTIYDELITFISAGHDTSSTTVCWGVKLLADNPYTQEKIRCQLFTSLHKARAEKRWPNEREILRTPMPYLDALVEEMLRLAQPVPGLVRQATVDTQILGCHIPKGTEVFMPCLEAKSRIRTWPEDGSMADFRPERWLVAAPADGSVPPEATFDGYVFDQSAGPMMAFSLGPRGCFGRRLAYVTLKILTTLIMWNFELLPCGEKLSLYKAHDMLTNRPDLCYVRLKSVDDAA
ncbi:hypothetical protein KVR01_002424 [Diaporthe batatas]|uniref:uncharacterized protein n=1 Tax=Diaporthe batatas TaxID=748121 RepID=UPI001D03B55C|nr:uncharacterized protein KVR01_002424 [Diaporthe batatas]KAG8166735.1 hypothetical protein KVR01_002424 [Diaporthe batatas]